MINERDINIFNILVDLTNVLVKYVEGRTHNGTSLTSPTYLISDATPSPPPFYFADLFPLIKYFEWRAKVNKSSFAHLADIEPHCVESQVDLDSKPDNLRLDRLPVDPYKTWRLKHAEIEHPISRGCGCGYTDDVDAQIMLTKKREDGSTLLTGMMESNNMDLWNDVDVVLPTGNIITDYMMAKYPNMSKVLCWTPLPKASVPKPSEFIPSGAYMREVPSCELCGVLITVEESRWCSNCKIKPKSIPESWSDADADTQLTYEEKIALIRIADLCLRFWR